MDFPINGAVSMLLRALNTLDYRIVDHGIRAAHITVAMMKRERCHTEKEITEAAYLALFHDIGAYKTEQLDSIAGIKQMLEFEVKYPMAHSVYGYIFLKSFSFLENSADAVLFHHITYPKLLETDCKNKELAAKLFLADRIGLMISRGTVTSYEQVLQAIDNPVFCPKLKALIEEAEREEGAITRLFKLSCAEELQGVLDIALLSKEQSASIIEMVPYIIDFRSIHTAVHTISVIEISLVIAELFGLAEGEMIKLYYGSLLHDIGKVATSVLILEKEGALDEKEFAAMKDHVVLSEAILKGLVSDEVLRIAVRHHEKLDGSGYHHGIKGEELSFNERIVAVADILSALMGQRSYKPAFPAKKVMEIVGSMEKSGKICPVIVKKVFENFELVEKRVNKCNSRTLERYRKLEAEHNDLIEQCRKYF